MSKQPWPAPWIVAGYLLAIAALVAVLAFPAHSAHAGLLDFIGEAAAGVADATWKVVLIKSVQSSLTTLIFMTCIIGTIACAWGAATISNKFTDLARGALRDDQVSPSEKSILTAVGLVDLAVVVTLFYVAYFLMGMAQELRA